MGEKTILLLYPELNYVKRWTDAVERGQYEEALSILDEGLRFAEERNISLHVDHFRQLRKITEDWRDLTADNMEEKQLRPKMEPKGKLVCSFCERKMSSSVRLVAGPKSYICYDCAEICAQIANKIMFPELEYIAQCIEAINRQEYKRAISISRQGLKVARELANQRKSPIFLEPFVLMAILLMNFINQRIPLQ